MPLLKLLPLALLPALCAGFDTCPWQNPASSGTHSASGSLRSMTTPGLPQWSTGGRARALSLRAGGVDDAPPLLIVGAGVLGRRAAALWQAAHPGAVVYGATREADPQRQSDLSAEGITPCVRSQFGTAELPACKHVLFCAPPGGNDDYAAEVASALRMWESGDGDGAFVFTSSAGVYAEQRGGVVREGSAVAASPRAQRLLDAESRTLGAGGTVLRLAGLYTLERGAHSAWFKMGSVASSPRTLINQVHYDDAAAAAVAALMRPVRAEVLVAADDRPLSRADICAQASRLPRFAQSARPTFTPDGDANEVLGKVIDSSYTREKIGWKPKYATFEAFVDQQLEQ